MSDPGNCPLRESLFLSDKCPFWKDFFLIVSQERKGTDMVFFPLDKDGVYTEVCWADADIIFSDCAGKLRILGFATSDPVTVSIKMTYRKFDLLMYPVQLDMVANGAVTLNIREILSAMYEYIIPTNVTEDRAKYYLMLDSFSIICKDRESEAKFTWNGRDKFPCLPGTGADETVFPDGGVVGYSPAIRKTYGDSAHYIYGYNSAEYDEFKIDVLVTFKSNTWETLPYPIDKIEGVVDVMQLKKIFVKIDCKLQKIRELAKEAGYNEKDVTKYEIRYYGKKTSDADWTMLGGEREFVVSYRLSGRTFSFRNSIGLLETIDSAADMGMDLKPDITVFKSSYIEREYHNAAVIKYKDGSGYLASKEEIRFWHEFLKSSEHYVWDGKEWIDIIIEEGKAETQERQLNEISFEWHFADSTKTL